jgi:hypothetical protein
MVSSAACFSLQKSRTSDFSKRFVLPTFSISIGGMGTQDGSVKKEYVEAYKRHKGALRSKRQSNTHQSSYSEEWKNSAGTGGDPDLDSLAAANEAIKDGDSVAS